MAESSQPSAAPSPPPSPTGPPAKLSVAWEADASRIDALNGVDQGLVVAPDLAAGGTKLRLLSWVDGSEVWSVDIADDLAGAEHLYAGPEMPPGVAGLWMHSHEGPHVLLVYDMATGQRVARVDSDRDHMAVASSGAAYTMRDAEDGSIRISRFMSFAQMDTPQWSVDLPPEVREFFWVREYQGVAQFCVDGQAGPLAAYNCYLHLRVSDGSPVVGDGRLSAATWVGQTLVGLDSDGVLTAVDPHGAVRWTAPVPEGYPVGWGDGLVYFSAGEDSAIVGLEPSTGKELWRYATPDTQWEPIVGRSAVAGEGRLVVVSAYPNVQVGALDVATGEFALQEHQLTEAGTFLLASGGAVLIRYGDYQAPTWTAVIPGQAGTMWEADLAGFDDYRMLHGHLIGIKGNRIALLTGTGP